MIDVSRVHVGNGLADLPGDDDFSFEGPLSWTVVVFDGGVERAVAAELCDDRHLGTTREPDEAHNEGRIEDGEEVEFVGELGKDSSVHVLDGAKDLDEAIGLEVEGLSVVETDSVELGT